jgi:starch synthase
MEKKRLLLITQELEPYTEGTETSTLMALLPKFLQDSGYELRILMPRFGVVNERRHRLHEVVRLSGMNIIVDDDDYPLLIKVASLPGTRLQVYFLDNEDFFKRKAVFDDENGQPFEDNIDRAAFFCKGAIETVKKFGWAPDIVLCVGWLAGLAPLYIKNAYKTEPLFANAQIIYMLCPTTMEQLDSKRFAQKTLINNLSKDDLAPYEVGDGEMSSMNKGAAALSDGLIISSELVDMSVEYLATADQEKILPWKGEPNFADYVEFFRNLTEVPVNQ